MGDFNFPHRITFDSHLGHGSCKSLFMQVRGPQRPLLSRNKPGIIRHSGKRRNDNASADLDQYQSLLPLAFAVQVHDAVPVFRGRAIMLSDQNREEILHAIASRNLMQQIECLLPVALLKRLDGFFVGS